MSAAAEAAVEILESRMTASLGTLHDGAPFVSMVPFALMPDGGVVIHVSGLASHTRDMLADPRVSLMVTAAETPDVAPQALARVTITGIATRAEEGEHESAAADAYLGRFPHAAEIAQLPDFSYFVIRPNSLRYVGGFARAATLTPDALAAAMNARR